MKSKIMNVVFCAICIIGCGNDMKPWRFDKYIIYTDETFSLKLLDLENNKVYAINSVLNTDAKEIERILLFDYTGHICLLTKTHLMIYDLNSKQSYNISVANYDDFYFNYLNDKSILVFQQDQKKIILYSFKDNNLESTELNFEHLDSFTFGGTATYARIFRFGDDLYYPLNKKIINFNITNKTKKEIPIPNNLYGEFFIVDNKLISEEINSEGLCYYFYDIGNWKHKGGIKLEDNYKFLISKRVILKSKNDFYLLLRKTDRGVFAVGYGDYYLLNIKERTLEKYAFDFYFRFGGFNGFLDKKYVKILSLEEKF